MKVLAVGLDETTVKFLRNQGIAVEEGDIKSPEELRDWLSSGLYDAGIINLQQSGLVIHTARELRANKITVPLVGICCDVGADRWGDHRATFLENGGDDLLRVPVNPRELVAVLRAVTRRFNGALLDINNYKIGGAIIHINLTTQSVSVNGKALTLTNRESAVFFLLASRPGRAVSKEMFMNHLYSGNMDKEPESKVLDIFICKVRQKLRAIHPDADKFIETVWGHGYSFNKGEEVSTKTKAA